MSSEALIASDMMSENAFTKEEIQAAIDEYALRDHPTLEEEIERWKNADTLEFCEAISKFRPNLPRKSQLRY